LDLLASQPGKYAKDSVKHKEMPKRKHLYGQKKRETEIGKERKDGAGKNDFKKMKKKKVRK